MNKYIELKKEREAELQKDLNDLYAEVLKIKASVEKIMEVAK